MFSRRGFLFRASAGASGLVAPHTRLFAASDFWNKKEAAEWSQQEIESLKTKSPWAKKVHGEGGGGYGGNNSMNRGGSPGTFGGMSGADSNGIGGAGGGRRGGGGDRDFGPGPATPQGPEVVIRWESAAPVLGATRFQLPAPLAEHYAVSITGVPPAQLAMAIAGRGGMGRGRNPEGDQPPAPPPSDPQAEAKARQERLLHTVTLTAKGHDPQSPDVVLQTADKETIIFGFPKSSLPLTANDKDVEFVMKIGFTVYKAKFQPKEMLYKSALAV